MGDQTGRIGERTLLQEGEQVAFLNSILASSTECSIIAKDLDGTITAWNEGAKRIYGYEAHELIGKVSAMLESA